MTYHILLVDDDSLLRQSLKIILQKAGYRVSAAANAEDALSLALHDEPDLILLDIGLPGMDGLDALRHFERRFSSPVIFITARRRELDEALGLELSADDSLTKPFSFKELLAYVRAVLNRIRLVTELVAEVEIVCGPLAIDVSRRRVMVERKEVNLTRKEFNPLLELKKNRNRVLLHEQLLTKVWGSEYRDDVKNLHAYIRYLRQKLEPDPANPRMILASRGVGYLLASIADI